MPVFLLCLGNGYWMYSLLQILHCCIPLIPIPHRTFITLTTLLYFISCRFNTFRCQEMGLLWLLDCLLHTNTISGAICYSSRKWISYIIHLEPRTILENIKKYLWWMLKWFPERTWGIYTTCNCQNRLYLSQLEECISACIMIYPDTLWKKYWFFHWLYLIWTNLSWYMSTGRLKNCFNNHQYFPWYIMI